MYLQLNPSLREIRLLCLHPGEWNDAIECHLQTVSLDKRPRFKAISYVWGDSRQKRPITVNDQSFATTKNLFAGLQRMRDSGETRAVWADAACINQADLNERCQQVQLMGDIYSSAEEVLIWLGYGGESQAPSEQPRIYQWTGDDTDVELVNAYFEWYQNQREEKNYGEDILGAFVFIRLRAGDKHLNEMPFFDVEGKRLQARKPWPAVVRALETLNSVPWWTRVWVLQETALARKATVIYNHTTAPWDMLARATISSQTHDQFCCEDLLNTRPLVEEKIITKLRRVVYDDIELLRGLRAQNKRISLSQVVSQTLQRDATDIRDKVYGLLGLTTNWYMRDPLLPDYTLGPREVFMRASLSELKGSLSLQGLMGTTRTDVPDVPSWVVRSSSSERWYASQESRINRTSLFCASLHTVANVERKGDVLVVDGFIPVDTVACIGPAMFEATDTWVDIITVVNVWRQMAELGNKTDRIYTRKQSWEEAFWRTTVNDCIGFHPSEKSKQQKLDPNIVGTVFRRLRDSDVPSLPEDWWSWLQLQPPKSKKGHNDENDYNNSPKSNPDDIRLFHQSFLGATALRRFFITTGGRMGLGPSSILPGDAMVILLGGDTPFSIRLNPGGTSNHSTLIGESYVHGLMDGEGVPANWKQKVIHISLK
ncbi:uncharacterized protein K460DRAFT_426459 [Cucurbitaria berberidis CBS 394.84]|uniref:Heterokaryon incompatibility domain-containing protein n=1 Tax=Cucurbitaria berberidis CBS 394.84 TaxID=1168544 RepID=A0A9P4GLA2_9PLEO|nr:uncharacterized protein K460DRAFT_426459 [Cucurbitaria berberidis CBS 394.84]KAF1847680.1 hypothetical protein K460DRAFT_426459 [Cucurbitaria berberidis CBS 394.84]